jgi:hypothetical protein
MIVINGKTHIFIYICCSMIFTISGDIVSKDGRTKLQPGMIVVLICSQKIWVVEVYMPRAHISVGNRPGKGNFTSSGVDIIFQQIARI